MGERWGVGGGEWVVQAMQNFTKVNFFGCDY